MSTRNAPTWIVLALALLVIAGVASWFGARDAAEDGGAAASPSALEPDGEPSSERALLAANATERAALSSDAPNASAAEDASIARGNDVLFSGAIVGRCMLDRRAAADVPVRLSIYDSRQRREPVVLEARTAANGFFRFDFEHREANAYHLGGGGGDYASWIQYPMLEDGRREVDVGFVHLERGCAIAGRVLSQDGRPVAGAPIVFARVLDGAQLATALADGFSTSAGTRTDEDGRFDSSGLPAAVWDVRVSGLGLRDTPPRRVDARAGQRTELELVVEVVAPVTGRLVARDGSPIAGVLVTCEGADSGEEASFERKSGADGGFELVTRPGWSSHEPLRVRLAENVSTHVAEPVPAEWGQHALLVARTTPRVRLRVIDEGSETPLREFAYRVNDEPHFGGALETLSSGEGAVEIPQPGVAPLWLYVVAKRHRARGPIELPQPDEGVAELVVALREKQPLLVDAVDEAGGAHEGATVELISLMPGTGAADVRMAIAAFVPAFFPKADAWIWGEGRTDAHGRVALDLPDIADELALRLTGAAGEQVLQRVPRGATRAQLVVPAGATVELELSGNWPTGMLLGLRCAERPELESVPRGLLRDQQRAHAVRLSGLATGTWDVRALEGGRAYTLTSFEIKGREEIVLALDATELLMPARPVSLSRTKGGALGGELVLEHEERAGWVELFRGPIRDGRVMLPHLPKGRYRARLTSDGSERLLDEHAWRELAWRFD